MRADIIHLIGLPGVGKLTIAREIVRQRPKFVVVDNELINNPIFCVMKADGKSKLPDEVWEQIFRIREVVIDTMARLSPPHIGFVMTNFLVEEDGDKAECRRIEAVAKQRGGLYFPVILTCDVEENRRRIVSPERSLNLKSIEPDLLERMLTGKPMLRYEDHPNRMEIDVTHLPPTDAASRILQEVNRSR